MFQLSNAAAFDISDVGAGQDWTAKWTVVGYEYILDPLLCLEGAENSWVR